jgi:hypothetical protein
MNKDEYERLLPIFAPIFASRTMTPLVEAKFGDVWKIHAAKENHFAKLPNIIPIGSGKRGGTGRRRRRVPVPKDIQDRVLDELTWFPCKTAQLAATLGYDIKEMTVIISKLRRDNLVDRVAEKAKWTVVKNG